MKKLLLNSFLLFSILSGFSQLQEKKNIRLYDHHSDISGVPFLGGDRSGYNLLNGEYVKLFEGIRIAISAQERAPIDLAEFFFFDQSAGRYTRAGFTSGLDDDQIGGNNLTVFSKANSSFNYENVSEVSELIQAFDANSASKTISNVSEGEVYIAKLREEEIYAAILIEKVMIDNPAENAVEEYYFDFSYKISESDGVNGGGESGGEGESVVLSAVDKKLKLVIFPNPVDEVIMLEDVPAKITKAVVWSTDGKSQSEVNIEDNSIDVATLSQGVHVITFYYDDGGVESHRFLKSGSR